MREPRRAVIGLKDGRLPRLPAALQRRNHSPELPMQLENPPPPSVSILIPAYNEERNLGMLLTFLRNEVLTGGSLLEVLIEISGSTDATREIAQEWARRWPAVRPLDSGARLGLLVALDRLIRASKGKILVRIDADVVLKAGTLDRLVTTVTSEGTGIASPRIAPLPSPSSLVRLASSAEWELHHRVSLRNPKTTLVQAFRRPLGPLPPTSGLEDAVLQEGVEARGLRAVYLAGELVQIAPPSSLRFFLLQRVRTVRHTLLHVGRGFDRPATASLSEVGPATLDAIRAREVGPVALAAFAALEIFAQITARIASWLGRTTAFNWEPVDGTKDTVWARPAFDESDEANRAVH